MFREAFSAVLESMESIGFSNSEVEQIITLLAAILHVGDIVCTIIVMHCMLYVISISTYVCV